MKLFFSWLKTKRKTLFLFLLFALIFAFSFLLYRLPAEAVIYPCALCLLAGGVFALRDFQSFKKKHDTYEDVKKLTAALIESLPDPETLHEKSLQELVLSLKQQNISEEAALTAKYRDMTEYYSVWAHQIKTPIASMKLTLQNEDSPVSRKLSSDLARIEQYVEMVLAFLRLDSPSTDYVFKKTELDPLIRRSVKKFAPDFIGKKIKLEYEPTSFSYVTDEKWFSFVLEQLLSNAVKYTGEGGSVKIYMTEPNTLCIADTGIGIAPDDLPRIFEKGYTGINGRADKSASGIGLYLCKRICKNLGIELSAQSEPGLGTAIMLDLTQKEVGE